MVNEYAEPYFNPSTEEPCCMIELLIIFFIQWTEDYPIRMLYSAQQAVMMISKQEKIYITAKSIT